MRLHLLPVSARRAITSQGAGCRKLSGLRPRLSRDVRHIQLMQRAHRIGVQRRGSQGLVRQIWQGPANSGVHPPLKPGPAPPGPARAGPLTVASSCQLGHSRAISSLAFSPASGTVLASAGGGPRPIHTHPPRHDPPEQRGRRRAAHVVDWAVDRRRAAERGLSPRGAVAAVGSLQEAQPGGPARARERGQRVLMRGEGRLEAARHRRIRDRSCGAGGAAARCD